MTNPIVIIGTLPNMVNVTMCAIPRDSATSVHVSNPIISMSHPAANDPKIPKERTSEKV
jgi:hypothetical protein